MNSTAVPDYTQAHRRLDLRCLLVLALIFGYCYALRFILIYFFPHLVDWTMPVSAHPVIRDRLVLWQAIGLAALFLLGFLWAIGIQLLLQWQRPRQWKGTQPNSVIPFQVNALLALTTFTAGAWISLLLSALGIGIQGQAPETALPFKLAGILIYLKSAAIPVAMLACVFLFESSGHTLYSRLTVFSLILLSLLDMILFESRGAALRSLLYIGLLWWVARFKLHRIDKILILAIVVTLPIMIAAVTEYRLYGESLGSSLTSRLFAGINFLMFRVTGAEHLTAIVGLHTPLPSQDFIDALSSPRGIPGYYTTELLGVDPNLPQTFAPSGLGWLYIFGGPILLALGGVLLGFLAIGVYNWIPQNLPVLGAAAKSLYILTLAMMLSEGTVEAPLITFILGYATLWLLEKMLMLITDRRHPNFGIQP